MLKHTQYKFVHHVSYRGKNELLGVAVIYSDYNKIDTKTKLDELTEKINNGKVIITNILSVKNI